MSKTERDEVATCLLVWTIAILLSALIWASVARLVQWGLTFLTG